MRVHVGWNTRCRRESVDHVRPKPGDVPALMEGLMAARKKMEEGGVPAGGSEPFRLQGVVRSAGCRDDGPGLVTWRTLTGALPACA